PHHPPTAKRRWAMAWRRWSSRWRRDVPVRWPLRSAGRVVFLSAVRAEVASPTRRRTDPMDQVVVKLNVVEPVSRALPEDDPLMAVRRDLIVKIQPIATDTDTAPCARHAVDPQRQALPECRRCARCHPTP